MNPLTAKKNILTRLATTAIPPTSVPRFPRNAIPVFPDVLDTFVKSTKSVGGEIHLLAKSESVDEILKTQFPNAKNYTANLKHISLVNRPLSLEKSPHDLQDIDVSIIQGEFGVAENAAVWVAQTESFRVAYFIAENLVLLLDRKQIVPSMHEAYEKINVGEKGFGIFISGPSKTADIEQSLVIGAHGPKRLLVILT